MARSSKDSSGKRRSKGRGSNDAAPGGAQPQDAMSQCVALCQEQRWREAVLLLRKMIDKADRNGKTDLSDSFKAALGKIEYSLRRQMAAAVTVSAKDLLAKEYLLDVGE